MAKAKDKYENFKAPIRRETGKSKPKEMSRTSGVARRAATPFGPKGALLTGSQITSAIKQGAPLTGSASGVKSISLKDAGEVLTQGIFSASRKGLKVDPAGLAMALPVGKVFKAGQALKAAGKFGVANQLLGRVAAKKAGQAFGKEYAISQRAAALDEATRTFNKGNRKSGLITKGETSRMTSEGASAHPGGGEGLSVFPRLPKGNLPPGEKPTFDVLADPFGEGSWRSADRIQPVKNRLKTKFNEFSKRVPSKGGRTLQLPDNATERFAAIDRTFSNLGAVRPAVPGAKKVATFPKRVVGKLPEPGSVEMVKQTAKQFGQKVSGKEAKNISRLLRGRDR